MADLKRQFLDLAAKIGLVKRAKPAVGAVAKKPVAANLLGRSLISICSSERHRISGQNYSK